jgi:hypothetical protein
MQAVEQSMQGREIKLRFDQYHLYARVLKHLHRVIRRTGIGDDAADAVQRSEDQAGLA